LPAYWRFQSCFTTYHIHDALRQAFALKTDRKRSDSLFTKICLSRSPDRPRIFFDRDVCHLFFGHQSDPAIILIFLPSRNLLLTLFLSPLTPSKMDFKTRSVADLTKTCHLVFSQCLTYHSLQKNQWAEDRLADFNIWAERVGALAASQASFDSQFQSPPRELIFVKGFLVLLQGFLNQCVSCAESGAPVHEAIYSVDSA
jgi:hypothetical protein